MLSCIHDELLIAAENLQFSCVKLYQKYFK